MILKTSDVIIKAIFWGWQFAKNIYCFFSVDWEARISVKHINPIERFLRVTMELMGRVDSVIIKLGFLFVCFFLSFICLFVCLIHELYELHALLSVSE